MKRFLKSNHLNNVSAEESIDSSCSPTLKTVQKNLKVSQGSALVMAAIFMTVATLLITVGMKLVSDSSAKAKQQEFSVADAENVAKAGVDSAQAWFVRQNSQPVAYYAQGGLTPNPTYVTGWVDEPFQPSPVPSATDLANSSVTATSGDSINTSIGMVNQFQIAPGIWGRYEVAQQPNPALTSPTSTPLPNAVHDISGYRIPNGSIANGSGLVWSVYSTGYVYRNVSSTVAYNVAPNKILAKANMVGEIRKLAYTSPALAGVITYNMGNIIFGSTNGEISAQVTTGGTYIGFACAAVSNITGKPVTTVSSEITGNKQTAAVSLSAPVSTTLNPSDIFGMTETDLKGIANFTGDSSQGTTLIINSSQGYQLYYYKGNLTYNPCNSGPYSTLEGAGILYVDGNLNLLDSCGGAGNSFSGVIYCLGNVYIGANTSVYGTIIATGSVSMTSSSSTGIGYVTYDQSAVNLVTSQVATYYEDKSSTHSIYAPNIH